MFIRSARGVHNVSHDEKVTSGAIPQMLGRRSPPALLSKEV